MSYVGRVALVGGFWAQNIGNAFFNIGGMRILKEVFSNYSVEFIQDQPGYWTFNFRRNPNRNIGILKHLETDYVVLQGPVLSKTYRKLWFNTLRSFKKKRTKIVLLSAGLFKYTDKEITSVRKMLKEVPPFIICTRDHKTYEAVADCCERSYSGIDSGFFVSDTYEPFLLDIRPYIAINFDRQPEPRLELLDRFIKSSHFDGQFEFGGQNWQFKFPQFQKTLAMKGKIASYLGAFCDFRSLHSKIGRYTIIRPEHRFAPHIGWKIYRHGNAIVADEPFTYLTAYGGTSLTLSDRVHACVATLSYGNPAMLFSPSPRTYLFDRLGLSDIRKRPIILESKVLEKEKKDEIEFLKAAIEVE